MGADPIGEDESERWRESIEVKPSLTLLLGETCLWSLSYGFAEGLVKACYLHHFVRCQTPAEGEPFWVSFPHNLRVSSLVSYMG